MIETIKNKKNQSIVNRIVSFESEVDDEIFIDYIFFEFSNNFSFGIHVDSSGENITFVDYDYIEESIKSTGISYQKKEILETPETLKDFTYQLSDIDELQGMSFILASITISISLYLDTFKLEVFDNDHV